MTDKEEKEKEKVERGVQGAETRRQEGEGKVRLTRAQERRGEIIGTHREAGVGEEVLCVQGGEGETCEEVVKSNSRGEAEGGQKDREKQEKEGRGETTCSKHPKQMKTDADITAAEQTLSSLCGPDMGLLTARLQEVQEEADRQAMVAQDLRSKLGEQSKKTWEAEQRLVVLEAELQHLRKAADSLGDARRQIEVRTEE